MRPQQAQVLAQRLLDAFPGVAGVTEGTGAVFYDRLIDWEFELAEAAVEAVIDSTRYGFPRVIDLREAYAAAGGDVPDFGRDMSPPVRRFRELTPAERSEADAARRELVERVREWSLRPVPEPPAAGPLATV